MSEQSKLLDEAALNSLIEELKPEAEKLNLSFYKRSGSFTLIQKEKGSLEIITICEICPVEILKFTGYQSFSIPQFMNERGYIPHGKDFLEKNRFYEKIKTIASKTADLEHSMVEFSKEELLTQVEEHLSLAGRLKNFSDYQKGVYQSFMEETKVVLGKRRLCIEHSKSFDNILDKYLKNEPPNAAYVIKKIKDLILERATEKAKSSHLKIFGNEIVLSVRGL
jgi:hypothetical protein